MKILFPSIFDGVPTGLRQSKSKRAKAFFHNFNYARAEVEEIPMARRIFNKECHFNTPRLEKGGLAGTCPTVSYAYSAIRAF